MLTVSMNIVPAMKTFTLKMLSVLRTCYFYFDASIYISRHLLFKTQNPNLVSISHILFIVLENSLNLILSSAGSIVSFKPIHVGCFGFIPNVIERIGGFHLYLFTGGAV
jgi:hypothetical protein